MKQPEWRPILLVFLILVSLAAFLPGFATIPPFDRDEARYAQATHQMLETGDFVDIRFQDEARHKKPVGIYWLQSASVHLLSGGADNGPIWMYRVPSLLGAVASVLLTAWVGLALFGPAAALIGGMMMATCVLLGVEARMAKTDAVQLATILAAMGVLARAYLRPDRALSLSLVVIFWLALGIGILVKGLILMVLGMAVLALWVMDRDAFWLRRLRPALGVPLMLAVVLPWLVAIGIASDGAFFTYAIGHEFLGKAHSVQQNHGAPPGYFLVTFWISFWPWAPLALLALPLVWRHRHEAAVRFCLAWIIPTWIIHEIVVTKLPHYILPVLPAVALLSVAMVGRASVGMPSQRWAWAAVGLAILVSLAFAVALLIAPYELMGAVPTGAVIAATSILVIAALSVGLIGKQWGRAAFSIAILSNVVHVGVFGLALPNLTPMWLSPRIEQVFVQVKPCDGSILATAGYNEPSMVFLVGTHTRLGNGETVAAHLISDPACAVGMVSSGREEAAFLAAMAKAGLTPRSLDKVSGFNYSRGKPVTLRFYGLSGALIDR